jgi:hypothetical protein
MNINILLENLKKLIFFIKNQIMENLKKKRSSNSHNECCLEIKLLKISYCDLILSKHYLPIATHLTTLDILINNSGTCSTLIAKVVANLPKLEQLAIKFAKGKKISSLTDVDRVSLLPRLRLLFLPASCLTDATIATILNKCLLLTRIKFNGPQTGLTSAAFTTLPVRVQLYQLNLKTKPSFFDEECLKVLTKCEANLRYLSLSTRFSLEIAQALRIFFYDSTRRVKFDWELDFS